MSGDLGIYDLIQYWSPITESIVFHCVRAVSEPAKGRLHHCFASLCGRPVYRALTDSLWKTVAIPIGHVNLQCIATLQSKFNSFRFPNSINKGPPGGRWVGVQNTDNQIPCHFIWIHFPNPVNGPAHSIVSGTMEPCDYHDYDFQVYGSVKWWRFWVRQVEDLKHIEAQAKWLLLRRQSFQMHSLGSKLSYFA